MKYIVLLGDGMADEPMAELDGRTPLQAARTPRMDALAAGGELGLACTVPEGYPPGSDVANLSVFGYDPKCCYSGRSPLEAASMGVKLAATDVAFRMNLVTLEGAGPAARMAEFSAGHIGTAEAAELVTALQARCGGQQFSFYPGVSYRHLLVWHDGCDALSLMPPHDITEQPVGPHLPTDDARFAPLRQLMAEAHALFADHPVNRARRAAGKPAATDVWFWGQGRAPSMVSHQDAYGITGGVISAVDLIRGIGLYAGLRVIPVPGATGYLDTNYRGKGEAALAALADADYVYVHVEAPDEAAHGGLLQEKIAAIEAFDALVVGTVVDGLDRLGPARLLVMPDHPTPVRLRTHTRAPVPYILYGTAGEYGPGSAAGYNEPAAAATGCFEAEGHHLMQRLMSGR